ncbi:MAG: hypothetical protein JST92_21300, partial [Deltaproteobacteria bacterium]|nr:hypothetical protein [Deltaproteobacteria bacterium]
MSASVLGFIEHTRRVGAPMPPALVASLLNAAARSAEKEQRPLRPDLVLVDELGRLTLAPPDFAEGPPPPGYVPPEVRAGQHAADDARALVYGAGAFGWHLLQGVSPSEERDLSQLTGPLGDIVRVALAQERRERFG